MYMRYGPLHFIDSLYFHLILLPKILKIFVLDESLAKGYFTLFFNKKENADYRGLLPQKEDYDIDVEILRKVCLKFREMLTEKSKVDPSRKRARSQGWAYCWSHLKENTSLSSLTVATGVQTNSHTSPYNGSAGRLVSAMSLSFMQATAGSNIFRVTCRRATTIKNSHNKTIETRYEATMACMEKFKNASYMVVEMCELECCDITRNDDVTQIEVTCLVDPPNWRQRRVVVGLRGEGGGLGTPFQHQSMSCVVSTTDSDMWNAGILSISAALLIGCSVASLPWRRFESWVIYVDTVVDDGVSFDHKVVLNSRQSWDGLVATGIGKGVCAERIKGGVVGGMKVIDTASIKEDYVRRNLEREAVVLSHLQVLLQVAVKLIDTASIKGDYVTVKVLDTANIKEDYVRRNLEREAAVLSHLQVLLQVAVKVIDTASIKEDYVRRNLEREAAVLVRLSHPSIVTLFQTIKIRIYTKSKVERPHYNGSFGIVALPVPANRFLKLNGKIHL
uniref:Uncharacterized protein n=1 Tax=Timema monikensis TaxID=170555 RepID=A0A7R9HT37_9NEOP|nr:unnamed protein product [Timema monikensis]